MLCVHFNVCLFLETLRTRDVRPALGHKAVCAQHPHPDKHAVRIDCYREKPNYFQLKLYMLLLMPDFIAHISFPFFFFLKKTYLVVPSLSCGIYNPVPRLGIQSGLPALEARSLSHWTTRKIPNWCFLNAT